MFKKYVSFEEEERCGYIVTKQQKKVWNIEINLLVEFMRVCDKNNLKYFVAHGTLLGAVRHRGFIPWDDDIDVNMPRADFEKLVAISRQEFQEPYFFQVFKTDKNSFSGIGKLRVSNATGMDIQDIGSKTNNGLFIDIFPMDGIQDDVVKRKRQSKKVERYRGLLSAKIYGKRYSYYHEYEAKEWDLLKRKSRFYSKNYLNYMFDKWCKKYTNIDCEREGIISFITDYECCYWYKEDYENLIMLDFESIKVPAPQNYDRCLRVKWGNYMEFPKEALKGKKHCDVIIDPDISYKDYEIKKFELDKIDTKRKTVLYGAGNLANEFITKYRDRFHITDVYDGNIEKIESKFGEMYVKGKDELIDKESKDINVIIAAMEFSSIEEMLIANGFENVYIYLPGRCY